MTLTKYHCIICERVTDSKSEYECDIEQILDNICDECKDTIIFAKELKEILKKKMIKEMCEKKMVENIHPSERLIRVSVGYCPVCGTFLSNKDDDETKFCKHCGQAVKWE